MMSISVKEAMVSVEIGSVRGTGKSDLFWEKNGCNFDSPSLMTFRPTKGVYIYYLKSANSVVLWASVGVLLVKIMNPARKITNYFIFSYFKRYTQVCSYRTAYVRAFKWEESRMEFKILFFNIGSIMHGKRLPKTIQEHQVYRSAK